MAKTKKYEFELLDGSHVLDSAGNIASKGDIVHSDEPLDEIHGRLKFKRVKENAPEPEAEKPEVKKTK